MKNSLAFLKQVRAILWRYYMSLGVKLHNSPGVTELFYLFCGKQPGKYNVYISFVKNISMVDHGTRKDNSVMYHQSK